MTTKNNDPRICDCGISGDHLPYMTVADIIKELQKLDQEKLIYLQYDTYDDFPPLPNELDEDGDYVIIAG